ncbi:MAG: hypothetical protein GC192_06300 [Bacteroidetes bacterium]|nr:hypothetical protein [Bacteroidota bacterium]
MKTNIEFPVIRVTIIAMLLVKAFFLAAQQCPIGTTDINAYIKDLPSLPTNTNMAATRAYGANPLQPNSTVLDNFYQPYEDKLNRKINEYQAYAKQKMEQGGATEADYMEQATAMANSNPIIANMGGYEKVSQMSEAEAKAAANQAAVQYMADPFAANGMQSAGMSALYQKIISDPAYAKKFEKMSEAEKEAELRKYMANDQPVAKTPAEMAQHRNQVAQQQTQADRIRNAQEIQLKIAEWQQEMTEIGMEFGQQIQEIEQAGKTHNAISEAYGKRYQAIPMVELGEYGRDHDPEKVRPLRIEEAKMHQERAQQELKENTAALIVAAEKYKTLISAYLDYIKLNNAKIYGGTSAKDMMEATNTEQPLLAFEAGLLSIGLQLSDYSKEITKKAANWEANYLQTIENNK